MAKTRTSAKLLRSARTSVQLELIENSAIEFSTKPKVSRAPIEAKNKNQQRYIDSIKNNTITFGIGPAGVGKTWICTALAAQALENKEIERIVLTRPAVEAGENLGFLPGEMEDKFDPYIKPFREVLNHRLGKSRVDCMMKSGVIEIAPLAYMRGATYNDAFIILDEAQNTSPAQMKMFLTRIGYGTKVVVNGDLEQADIPGLSGLEDAVDRFYMAPQIKVVEFDVEDVVRSGIVQTILAGYRVKKN